MIELNLANFIECTESEGPGRRFAIWIQGCLKRCRGCCNPEMLEIIPKKIIDCDSLLNMIIESKDKNQIEGVTFSYVSKICRDEKLSVMTFTGYTIKELTELELPYTDQLLQYTVILVDGKFLINKIENDRNWIGSENQKIYYLTKFYQPGIEFDKST